MLFSATKSVATCPRQLSSGIRNLTGEVRAPAAGSPGLLGWQELTPVATFTYSGEIRGPESLEGKASQLPLGTVPPRLCQKSRLTLKAS